MKTMALRRPLREPGQVKRWTRSGETVVITDSREPLRILRAAGGVESDPIRDQTIDEILEEALRAARSDVSAVRLLEESRR